MRIATYNVQNLFAPDSDHPKPAQQMRPLIRMFDQVAADLWILQEVGSQQALDNLNARLAQPFPLSRVVIGNSNRSIHLAVLARADVACQSHRHHLLRDAQGEVMSVYTDETQAQKGQAQPLGFLRDLLRVELMLANQQRLAIYGVHLKSRTNTSWQLHAADAMRGAECRALVDIVKGYQARHPDEATIVMGDFNDLLVSDALSPLKALALRDPLGETLRAAGRNPATYWPKRRMRIDHILLCERAYARFCADSAQIHSHHMARTASDHYPVSLALTGDTNGP